MKIITSPDHLYPGIFDSHTHLYHMHQKGLDIRACLQRWHRGGLHSLLDVVLEESEDIWQWHLAFAAEFSSDGPPGLPGPRVLLACGLHPNDAERLGTEALASALAERLSLVAQRVSHPSVCAVGETGLDVFHSLELRDIQIESFLFHIHLAKEYKKPLIVHNRDTDAEILRILKSEKLPKGGILHCFSGNLLLVEHLVPNGFYFSFAGNLTYKNSEELRQAAALIPLDRLLIETDAPFLAPQAVRGQINHPGFIGHTLDHLAEVRGMAAEELLPILRKNWDCLFPLQGNNA